MALDKLAVHVAAPLLIAQASRELGPRPHELEPP
jgi:hypothetical protein